MFVHLSNTNLTFVNCLGTDIWKLKNFHKKWDIFVVPLFLNKEKCKWKLNNSYLSLKTPVGAIGFPQTAEY